MGNREIAGIFEAIGDFLEMEEVEFKPRAYHRAARHIRDLEAGVEKIYGEKGKEGLKEIPGVGESLAEKIEEYIRTGEVSYYERLKEKSPFDIEEITRVEGMGPKRARKLYRELEIRDLEDLEKMARNGRIAPLSGFGEKTEQNILEGIEFLKGSRGRFLLGEILPEAEKIEERLNSLDEVERVKIAGSVRRRKATIGDIDILVSLEDPENGEKVKKVMDFFVNLSGVVKVWGRGPTKSSVRFEGGLDTDLRIVPPASFGAALQYFTGSKEHNIEIRKIAKRRGLKLSEYGLFRGEERIAGATEQEVYEALGMDWVPPEMRTDSGEIEAALRAALPDLVGYGEIKGDLHIHSSWNGGVASIEEMAKRCQEMGYEYIGLSDHTKFLRIENGLDEERLAAQRKEIDGLNTEFKSRGLSFRILQGAETNILEDGSLDLDERALARLDFVTAGVHSRLGLGKKEMTERLLRAVRNPEVNIISHPTGRLLKERKEVSLDFDRLLRVAEEHKVALEVNSSPVRLDLCDAKIRRAVEAGVKLVINTDSHNPDHLRFITLGIAQARRGWAEKEDLVNTWSLEKVGSFFEK